MEDKWLCLENTLEHGLHEEAEREKIKSLIEGLKAAYNSKTRFAEWIRVKARAIEEDLAVHNNEEKARHLFQLAEMVDKATD